MKSSFALQPFTAISTRGDVFFSLRERDLIAKEKKRHGSRGGKLRPDRAPKGESIERRPAEINERVCPGDWEMDSGVGTQGTKECPVVLTERYARMKMDFLVPDHTAASDVQVLNRIEEGMGMSVSARPSSRLP